VYFSMFFFLVCLLLLTLFLDSRSMHHCNRPAPTTQYPLFYPPHETLNLHSPALALSRTRSCSSPRFIPFDSCFFINFHYLSCPVMLWVHYTKDTRSHSPSRRNARLFFENWLLVAIFELLACVGRIFDYYHYYHRRLLFF